MKAILKRLAHRLSKMAIDINKPRGAFSTGKWVAMRKPISIVLRDYSYISLGWDIVSLSRKLSLSSLAFMLHIGFTTIIIKRK